MLKGDDKKYADKCASNKVFKFIVNNEVLITYEENKKSGKGVKCLKSLYKVVFEENCFNMDLNKIKGKQSLESNCVNILLRKKNFLGFLKILKKN